MDDKRKTLYDALSKDGYDVGDYDSYINNLNDEAKRKSLYDAIKDVYDIGDYDSFSRNIIPVETQGPTSISPQRKEEVEQSILNIVRQTAVPEYKQEPGLQQMVDNANRSRELKPTYVPSVQQTDAVQAPRPVVPIPIRKDTRKRDEEAEIDNTFTAMPENTESDVYRNFYGRFSLTERGKSLQKEMADKEAEVQKKYLDEFQKSPEYLEYVGKTYTSKEEAEEADKRINVLFAEKYGASIDKDMKPYQDAYYSAVIDRYGDQINEHTNSIVKRNAADQLDQLQRDIDMSVLDNKKKLKGYSANDARGALQSSYNYSMNGDVGKHRQDAGALEAANRLTEEAKEIVKEASKKGKTNFVAGLLRGFRDNAFDAEQWSMGVVDLADNTYLLNALQKFDRGKKLSDAEEKLLEASSINMIVNAYYAQDLGRGYKAGQVTAQSIPFMLEFVANPISASGSTLAKGLLKYAGKAFGKDITKRASIKMGTRFLGDLGAAAGMTLTTGAAGTLADAQQRMIGNYDYGKDSGVMRVKKTGDTGFGEALGKSALSRTVENQSEMIFNTLRAGGPIIKTDVVSKVPFFNKLANSDIVKLVNKWKDVPTVKNIRQRAQIGGVLEEYGEEVYNNMVSVATGEMDGNDAFSLDTNIDTFLGLVPTQLAFAALGVGGAAIQESKSRKRVREFQRNMNPEDQVQFEEFRQAVEMGDYESVPRNYIRSIIEDNTKSDEEKRTMIFAVREEVMAHKAQEVRESQTEPEDVAYNEGQSGDIAGTANNLDRLEAEAMRITGASNQEELNELLDTYERNGRGDTKAQRIADAMYNQDGRDNEAVRIMLDYLNADAKFKGASNYVMDRVDEAVEEENSKIDAITHKNGFIQPATMKNDHPVYITSGNIVTLPDGTIDREKSDQDIIVFDQTTGKLEFTTADQILEMGIQSNPEEIKAQNAEIVSQQIISESEMMMNAQVVEETQQDALSNEPETITQQENQGTLTEETNQAQEIPVDEEGEPIFTGIDPSLTIDYIYNQSGLEEQDADEFVNQKIAESAKNAAGIEKKKPKVGSKIGAYKREIAAWETERDAAQEELNYWTNIQNQIIQSRNQPKTIEQQQDIIDVVESDVPDVVNDKAVDARARGYRMVNGYRVDRPSPIRSNQGANTEIRFSTKDAVPGGFAVIEAGSLQPSHVNGQRNPYFFINEAQPKDRVDDASIKAADDIASAIRPEEITGGVTAYTGSPVVNTRGEVVQGNNRSAALRIMYQSNAEQSEIYKNYLRNHAVDYGLTKEQVDEMEQPVLVRIADVSDVQAIRLGQMTAQDTESGGIERIKPVQTYNKMGDSAGSFVNILLNSEDENRSLADLVAENGVAALKYLAQKQAISDTQYQSAFDRNGNLTPEAKQDLTQIVEASLFEGGPDLLPQMFRTLPAKSQKAILSTFSRDRNSEESKQIRKDIHNAIQVFYEAMQDADFASATNYESAKRALESWKRQINMMDGVAPMDKFDNFAIELAARFKGNTMKRTAEEFNAFYNLIQGEQDLFSESGPVSKNEAINQIYNINESRRENAPDVENNTGRGEERGSGSNRDDSSGELNPEGGRIADTGRGIESNDRQDGMLELQERSGNGRNEVGMSSQGNKNRQPIRSIQEQGRTGTGKEVRLSERTGLAQRQEVNIVQADDVRGGIVYGATIGGKIYLNGSALNPESPIHEYTHIWDEACRKNNPELWNRGVELMKQTPMWEEVKNDPNYSNLQTDNEIASEVHSRLTGADGAERMEQMVTDARKNGAFATAEAISLREQLKKWLSDFWWWLKDTMIPWTKEESQRVSLEDFINMPLKDLANGINLNNTTDENVRFRIGETGSGILDKYDRGQIVLEQYSDKGINSDNVNLALYDLFGVFAGRLYENGVLGNVLKETTINEEKAKEEYERAEIYLNEYATVLNDLKDNSTEAAKAVIDEEINDIKRSIQYYKELAEGKDEWRWDSPRFRSISKLNISKQSVRFGKMLGADITIANTVEEVENSKSREAIENGRNVKGWFEPSTGKVVLYMPNIENEADAQATILHEIVGHKGLRELFGDRFDKFLYDVFSRAEEPIRKKIAKKMLEQELYGRLDIATEEYLAEMAERGFKENERGFWEMVKRLFSNLLHEARIRLGFTLRDSDLRYILWRSYQLQRERGALAEAANIAMKQNLGLDEAPQEVRFRISEEQRDNEYDNALKGWRYKLQEAYQDSMLALKKLQEIISKITGPILDSENAYMAENQLSSKNKIESEIYRYRFFNPMIDAVTQFMEESDVSYDEVLKYLVAKHGLERNRVFALRDAIDATENPEETAQKIDEAQLILMNDKEAGKLDDMAYEVELENMYKKLAPEYENFRKRDYSGLKALTGSENNYESEAQVIVDKMEMSGDTNSLWDAINKATKETLKKSYESGMMNRKQYDHVNKMFEYYVPLRGWSEDVASDVYEYLINERSIFNAPVMRAGGRTSLADDPLATIGSMAESAIIQGNRNLMKQKFLNFALNHKTPLLSVGSIWYENVGTEEKPVWQESIPDIPVDATTDEMNRILEGHEEMMKSLQKDRRATKKRSKIKLNYKSSKKEQQEHAVRVKRNGNEYVIYVNGNPRAAQAINGLTNPDSYNHKLLNAVSWMNRQMAANFTSRNPAFVLTNLSRDLIFAGTAVAVKEDSSYRKQYTRNILRIFGKVKTFSMIRDLENDRLGDSEVEKYFKEFIENGGETGYTNLNSVDEYKKLITQEILKTQGKVDLGSIIGLDYGRFAVSSKVASPISAIKAVSRWTELFNRSAEDMTRFAVYMTSRQMGRSIQKSVSDAKEITVNFNKKGAGGLGATTFKALYLFFNAAVQSLANFGRLAKNNPGKFTAMLGSTMMLGVLLPMANEFMINAFGDDDDKDAYYNLPEWVRRNNLVFWLGGDRFMTIPLPIEMRVFYGIGELFFSYLNGKETNNIGGEIVKQFSDLLPLDMTGNGGDFTANIMPDAIKPIYQIHANKDFFGKPIFKDYDYNKLMPEWTKAYQGTNRDLIKFSESINEITGGTKYRKGLIDINPAVVEHLFDSYFGGLGKTANQAYKTIFSIWDEDLRNTRNIPVLNRFYTKEDERTQFGHVNNKFYEYMDEFKQTQQELNGYKKEAQKGVFDYAEDLSGLVKSPQYRRFQIIIGFNKNTDGLKKAINMTPDKDGRKKLENLYNLEKARLVEILDKINE